MKTVSYHPKNNPTSDFSWSDVLSVAAVGVPTKVLAKITGEGTTANKIVSLAVTGNPNAISVKKATTTTATNTTKSALPEETTDATDGGVISSNMTKYIVYGLIAILIIGILIYFFKKR